MCFRRSLSASARLLTDGMTVSSLATFRHVDLCSEPRLANPPSRAASRTQRSRGFFIPLTIAEPVLTDEVGLAFIYAVDDECALLVTRGARLVEIGDAAIPEYIVHVE